MNAHPNPITSLIEKAIALAGSEAKLGAMAGYSQNAIWSAKRNGRISPELADAIQKATGGLVRRQDLRPDIFAEDGDETPRPPKAQRLFDLRGAADYPTATAGARAAGVSVSTYIHHENGTREYDEEAARIYAEAFGSSVAWLLLGVRAPDEAGPARNIPGQNNIPKLSELREQIEEIADLLHALDKIGDGIGGADGYSVSAVAIAAKSVADNALDAVRAMGGK